MRETTLDRIEKPESLQERKSIISFFLESPWWLQVLLITLTALVLIQIGGLIGVKIIAAHLGWGRGVRAVGHVVDLANTFPGWFVRWDSGYYLLIVESGYTAAGSQAFFPLYPFLVSTLIHISGLPEMWSGILISAICFLASSVLLYRWALIDYQASTSRWTVIWFCIFPIAFFLAAIYAESLFLLCSIASIYFARKGNFLASGLAICLAGATRPYGFLLAIPFIIEFIQQHNFQVRQWVKFIAGALIAPLGTLGYLTYLAWQTGNHNLWAVYRNAGASWSAFSFAWPWNTWLDGLRAAFFGTGLNPDWFSRALAWQDLSFALLGLVLSIYALKHLRLSLGAYVLISMLFFYTNHGPKGYAFYSISRHIMILFPFYLVLALLTQKLPGRARWIAMSAAMILLCLFSAWFASGRWVA